MSHLFRTPPRPLSEAVSQPDLYCTPDNMLDIETNARKRKCLSPKVCQDSKSPAENITLSMEKMLSNMQQMFMDLKESQDEQFAQIKQDIGSLKKQNVELLVSNLEIKKSVAQVIQDQSEMKKRIEKLEEREAVSDEYVRGLEQQVDNMERKLKETSIEINNVPTESNEQMITIIAQIHKMLKVEYDPRDLRCAYRLPAKQNSPRPIIIEYTSVQKKIELLQAFKNFGLANNGERLWTAADGAKRNIYMNEVLTKKGRHLHYRARMLIRNSEWKFCWTVNGKIYIRKIEGQPAVEVKSEAQIASLYKETNLAD